MATPECYALIYVYTLGCILLVALNFLQCVYAITECSIKVNLLVNKIECFTITYNNSKNTKT